MAISDCVALDALRVGAGLKGIAHLISSCCYSQSIITGRISDDQGIIRIQNRTIRSAVAAPHAQEHPLPGSTLGRPAWYRRAAEPAGGAQIENARRVHRCVSGQRYDSRGEEGQNEHTANRRRRRDHRDRRRPDRQPPRVRRDADHRARDLGRTAQPGSGHRHAAAGSGTRRQLHRHCGLLRTRGQRDAHRPGAAPVPGRPGDRDQGRPDPPGPNRWDPEGRPSTCGRRARAACGGSGSSRSRCTSSTGPTRRSRWPSRSVRSPS